jgi:flagellar biosynthetic protein FliP
LLLLLASSVDVVAQENPRSPFAGDRQFEKANEPAFLPSSLHERPVATNESRPAGQAAGPSGLSSSLKMLAAVTVLGLVPSILLMMTCFVRFTVVLSLLRQAMGTSQALPNQIMTALAMLLTFLVMAPVWQRAYEHGIGPYTNPAPGEQALDEVTAFQRTAAPVRDFMSKQIDQAGNADAVWMLIDYQRPEQGSSQASNWHEPTSYDDVPLTVLAPAYLLSELKVAFLIGFQIFLPFLVIDMVVASVLTSLGLNMLPPSMVSLPCKLLLFVAIDGWFLTIGMLLESVRMV